MGSTGFDWRCPWCGRVGNGGGYAPDGIDYPICCGLGGGTYSCLWTHVVNNGHDRSDYTFLALAAIFCKRSNAAGHPVDGPGVDNKLPANVLWDVASFL